MPDSLTQAIRNVPDFPSPGIQFKDITPILSNPALFQQAVDSMVDIARSYDADKIVGLDARGFLFGPPVALALGIGFVPVRKAGKLPASTISESYSLEYGDATLEIHQDALQPNERVLIVDDLLATGGTASASIKLIERLGARHVASVFLIELSLLNGRAHLDSAPVHSITQFT
ncbi:adenine phosphoribosyltransferase [Rubritalea marina]|uniref:adenine phosphoribosyltransferase n=1 Tax=Rubritalea marina TaxID=361055 RepID=UPI00036D1CF4|nr:adenine phosphoribosyltransferase [Rubritalea marina]